MHYNEVIEFWFSELGAADWFAKSDDLDNTIKERFAQLHHAACLGECYSWRENAAGRLAEIIVLDQFSRNMYRETPQSFASDAQALALAQEAVAAGADKKLNNDDERAFLYMPYMHSESLMIQDESVKVFNGLKRENYAEFAREHRDIIVPFGRYPYRNEILGRTSTPEEIEYLASGGARF